MKRIINAKGHTRQEERAAKKKEENEAMANKRMISRILALVLSLSLVACGGPDAQPAIDAYNKLAENYNTFVEQGGTNFSGGQKQRLSIARVFLKDPAILILDEATSALDNTTEILIQSALDELCKGRTTLIVAHRLSTIRNADEIAVVDSGKIVERGSHDALMAKQGIYKDLYSLQFTHNDVFEE